MSPGATTAMSRRSCHRFGGNFSSKAVGKARGEDESEILQVLQECDYKSVRMSKRESRR